MEFCTGCGHRLGIGRFCTNCGQPIGTDPARVGGAEHPPVHVPAAPPPADPPPPAYTPPTAPRYPLYVDEATGPPAAAPTLRRPSSAPKPSRPPRDRRPGPSFLAVALTVVILLLVAAIGGLLMFSGDDGGEVSDPTPVNGTADNASPPPSQRGSDAPRPSDAPPPPDGADDLATSATASATVTAKPNRDTQGNRVTYEADNLVDGVATTCWRMPGDGTGQELTFALPEATEISQVGLINGYAKRSGALDWYAGNRRVLAVEWVFDDGTVVPQALDDDRTLQTMAIEPVTSSNVVLRLVSVSEPGRGPSARNYTPISEISLVGEQAGN